MALEPCKVCGALTSMEADECYSCGFPPTGRKRSPVFTWAAIILAGVFVAFLVIGLLSALGL